MTSIHMEFTFTFLTRLRLLLFSFAAFSRVTYSLFKVTEEKKKIQLTNSWPKESGHLRMWVLKRQELFFPPEKMYM